jgi:diketogulonate reductase-like aldo/keto reductase
MLGNPWNGLFLIMKRRESIQLLTSLGLLPLLSAAIADDTMAKRAIPKTGEQLPVIGLGTWETFDIDKSPQELSQLKDLLKVLIDKGGKVADTSPMYGFAERNLGKLSNDLSINDKLFIATKVWTQGKDKGIDQMNNSFSMVKRKKMDLMQIHNLVDWQTHLKTLREWKEKGKIRYIGITHYLESSYPELEKIMNDEPIDFLQVNYNLTDRKADQRLLPLAKEKKIAVIISQPFNVGKLFKQVENKKLPTWAADFDCKSWAQFFLKFILSHPAVTCTIPGTSTAVHMQDNVMAGFGKLPDEKQRQLMIKEINK